MKTTIILLFLCLFSKAQNSNFITINIWRVLPQNVCKGDSVKVNFKFTPPQQGTLTTAQFLMNSTQVWIGNYNLFYNLPKETFYPLATNDSCYTIWLKTTTNMFGYTNINTSGTGMSFNIDNCTITNIYEQTNKLQTIEPIYFDLYGNKINKEYNTLIIEQIGLNRRKLIIYN